MYGHASPCIPLTCHSQGKPRGHAEVRALRVPSPNQAATARVWEDSRVGKVGSVIQSTPRTWSTVIGQPVKTRTQVDQLQVCLLDCPESSKSNNYEKAVALAGDLNWLQHHPNTPINEHINKWSDKLVFLSKNKNK